VLRKELRPFCLCHSLTIVIPARDQQMPAFADTDLALRESSALLTIEQA
jgi:hypothetical protein